MAADSDVRGLAGPNCMQRLIDNWSFSASLCLAAAVPGCLGAPPHRGPRREGGRGQPAHARGESDGERPVPHAPRNLTHF